MSTQKRKQNREYNNERKAQSEWLKLDVEHDKVLISIHDSATERIQKQIDEFYLKYATAEGLTKAEAMKKANQFDVTKYFDRARRAVEQRDFSKDTNEWLKTYNLKMKTSRLEVLKAEIQLNILEMTDDKEKYMTEQLENTFSAEYNRQKDLIKEHKRQAGILGNSAVPPSTKYKGIINADFYGANYSDRIWGYRAVMQKEVFSSLNRIYTDMMGYQQERSRLINKFGVTKYDAQRLLRTEMRRVNSTLQKEMLEDNDFTHMILVTEPGACDICAPMENMAIPISKIELGVNQPPLHPNCYCTMYGHIEMEYIDGGSTIDEFKVYESS